MSFDPLTTTAADLRRLLAAGEITSVQIVQYYLVQIERYNSTLCAVISIAPRELVLNIASARDVERRQGRARGPLHGIPIVLKDSFMTAPELGMSTTAGAVALLGAKAGTNAA
jgi:amidase